MSAGASVTRWVTALKGGDLDAARPLWERYHRQLIDLARQKLRTSAKRGADEEDIVQNAFHSFFQGVARGRYPRLDDRDNLWRLLVVITARKAVDQLTYEHAQRRGGGALGETEDAILANTIGDEPTPEFAAQVAEEYERLLDRLGDPVLRRIAFWKMQGFTNDEIAAQLDCTRRTVIRKLERIRVIWSDR